MLTLSALASSSFMVNIIFVQEAEMMKDWQAKS